MCLFHKTYCNNQLLLYDPIKYKMLFLCWLLTSFHLFKSPTFISNREIHLNHSFLKSMFMIVMHTHDHQKGNYAHLTFYYYILFAKVPIRQLLVV